MKPAHQWETRAHLAKRSDEKPVRGLEEDPRAEAFVLHFHDGRVGSARLGLEAQFADDVALSDPDFPFAVRCWLVARGVRSIRLFHQDQQGTPIPVVEGTFTVAQLADPFAAQAPKTLISLCPSNAEMIDALGVFDRVIACEDSSDHPPAVQNLPRLGPDLGPDLDRVRELSPDLVVSSLSVPGMERIVTGLRARGVPQIVLAPRSLNDVLDECEFVGTALGVAERGKALRARMEQEIAALVAERAPECARVYLEWWPKPMFTPGRECYSNELIRLAGGINVFGDRAGSSVEVTREDLVAQNPDVCFVSWCGVALEKLDPESLQKRGGLESLDAVQRRRVYPLDERFSGRPGPRMLEAARVMARAIRELRAAH